MIDCARENKVILLEAMRPDFDPAYDLIEKNLPRIGKLRRASFEFCQYSSRYDSFREGVIQNAFNPELGNAAVMDIGVYCIHSLVRLFGAPKNIKALSTKLSNGFDGNGIVLMEYEDMTAEAVYSKIAVSVNPSVLQGEDGSIMIDYISKPETVRLRLREGSRDTLEGGKFEELPYTPVKNNMIFEIQEFLNLIQRKDIDHKYLQYSLDSIRVISDREFEVVWKKRYFLSLDMTLSLSPLPRHLYHAYDGPFDPVRFNEDHERNRILVGCGPYRFVKWDKGHRILLTRWEKYYGRRYGVMPPIRNLAFDVIQHPNTRLQALLSKDLDTSPLTPDQWIHRTASPEFGEKGFLRKIRNLQLVYNYLGFNLSNPLFRDAKTRVALSHLIDRDRIVKDIYYGLARPVSGPFFPEGPACDKSIAPYPYSPARARELLAEAGWRDTDNDGILERDGLKFRFTLVYPNANETYKRMLPIIKEEMAKAGVQMELLGLEWSVCVQRLEKKSFDMCALAWSGGLNPDPFQLWHSSQADIEGSSNHIRFKNAEADRLIEQIRVTFDPAERQKLYHRFHRLVHEEQPYIFLFAPFSLNALNRRYHNFRLFPLGFADMILWTPKAEQMTL